MGVMVCYFKGVRLWEVLQQIRPPATRTGAGQHSGITQAYGKENPQSPNFVREVVATTVVEPVDAGHASDADEATTVMLALIRTEERLIAVAKTSGHVSWCQDVAQKADVTGGAYTGDGAVVTHGAVGASWVPAVGRLVLCRNPVSGEGFVATIDAVDPGVSMAFDIPAGHSVGSAWDLVSVQLAFPSCSYSRMSYGTRTPYQGGEWRPSVEYAFAGHAAALYSVDHAVAVDDT